MPGQAGPLVGERVNSTVEGAGDERIPSTPAANFAARRLPHDAGLTQNDRVWRNTQCVGHLFANVLFEAGSYRGIGRSCFGYQDELFGAQRRIGNTEGGDASFPYTLDVGNNCFHFVGVKISASLDDDVLASTREK